MKRVPLLLHLAIAGSVTSVSYAQTEAVPETPKENVVAVAAKGQLVFKVIIVDDLVPRPVPLNDFKVQLLNEQGEPTGDAQTFRTGEDGTFNSDLAPGKYVIQSAKPLKFKGRLYEWKREFTVTEGQTATLQLTGEDATTRDEAIPTVRQVADEAKVYRAKVDGVATIEGEAGHGTGFLIDSRGLILTNQHVVAGSSRLVVRFHSGLRVEGKLVGSDQDLDVAIVRVHPSIVKGMPVIALYQPKDGDPLVIEGEKILAIGSPISEEKVLTTGLVSRVKDGVIISDVNINPGNSGGPLLNLAGDAVGITTFGTSAAQGGPGLSGIVSIERALPLVAKAQATLNAEAANAALPSDKLLPDFSTIKVPATLLTAAAQTELKVPQLNAPSSFQTRFVTPFILASLEFKEERELAKKKDKRKKNQSAYGEGNGGEKPVMRFYSGLDSEIVIAIAPVIMESKSSKKKGLFGAFLGGMTGTPVNTKKSYEFRHEFYDMELSRDGVRVEPLRRKRIPVSYYYENQFANVEAKDSATAGLYSYDPAAFRPGGKLELKVKREYNTQKWDTVKISEALQASLYKQFEGYWQFAQSPAASTSAIPGK